MLTVVVTAAVLWWVYRYIHKEVYFADGFIYTMGTFVGLCASALALLVLKMMLLTPGEDYRVNVTTDEVARVEIASIALGSEVEGAFFLGIGEVDSKSTYFGYQKMSDLEFQLLQMNGKSVIQYSDETPVYITYTDTHISQSLSWKRWLFLNPCWTCEGTVTHHRILVPHGTIQEQYNL